MDVLVVNAFLSSQLYDTSLKAIRRITTITHIMNRKLWADEVGDQYLLVSYAAALTE